MSSLVLAPDLNTGFFSTYPKTEIEIQRFLDFTVSPPPKKIENFLESSANSFLNTVSHFLFIRFKDNERK